MKLPQLLVRLGVRLCQYSVFKNPIHSMQMKKVWLIAAVLAGMAFPLTGAPLVYEGDSGIGKGKHIVFIANDHEYRSEESSPLIAKIMAKRFGFRCTVLFGLDENGSIKAGAKDLPGMEALKDADLLFLFARFMNLENAQADLLVDYFERGGPVVGLRTSTHAFNGQKGKWEKLNFKYAGDDYRGGLGEQVFGNTWDKERGQSHYGSNHSMGSTITPVASAARHPIMKGVDRIHAYSGAYRSQPPADAFPLLEVQVLNTFHDSNDINAEKPIVNAGWTRDSYIAPSGAKKKERVVYASYGASEDLLSEDGRRFLVNACLWAGGWEKAIRSNLDVSIVGGFDPHAYTAGAYRKDVKPQDLAGWNSTIMPKHSGLTGLSDPNTLRRLERVMQNRPEMRKRVAKQRPDLIGPDGKFKGAGK